MVNNMKFKNIKTGVIVNVKNMHEENILKNNPNYIVFKDVEEKAVVEKKTQRTGKKVADK